MLVRLVRLQADGSIVAVKIEAMQKEFQKTKSNDPKFRANPLNNKIGVSEHGEQRLGDDFQRQKNREADEENKKWGSSRGMTKVERSVMT